MLVIVNSLIELGIIKEFLLNINILEYSTIKSKFNKTGISIMNL